jgi:hypothetical protein
MRFIPAACFLMLAVLTLRHASTASAAELEQRGEFARALDLNPRLSGAWIALGLAVESSQQESSQHPSEARRDLLEAARVDHGYLPAWTLANFYYRQSDYTQNGEAEFWPWAHRAAALSYDDLRPLLRLAHSLDPDPLAVESKLGPTNRLQRADLDYLIGSRQWDQAQQVARALAARNRPADRPRLLAASDRQLEAGNVAYARELWNVFYPPLTVSNGAFGQAPSNLGFDWRIPRAEGVVSSWEPGMLKFSFDGAQCENCALLEQVVPLAPASRRYQLDFEVLTTGLSSPSGLHWDLGGHEDASIVPASMWTRARATFSPPAGAASRLRLIYRREPGTVRAPGLLALRNLKMTEVLP